MNADGAISVNKMVCNVTVVASVKKRHLLPPCMRRVCVGEVERKVRSKLKASGWLASGLAAESVSSIAADN